MSESVPIRLIPDEFKIMPGRDLPFDKLKGMKGTEVPFDMLPDEFKPEIPKPFKDVITPPIPTPKIQEVPPVTKPLPLIEAPKIQPQVLMPEITKPKIPAILPISEPLPKSDWFDKIKEIKDKPTQLIPFVQSGVEIYTIGKLIKTTMDLEAGREVGQEDLLKLKEYVDRSNKDTTWGYKVLDIVGNMIPFAGEFLATGGIYAAGSKIGMKAGAEALKRIATKSGAKLLEKKLVQFGLKTAGVVAGGTLQAIPAGITRIPAETLEKQLQGKLTGDEKAIWESAVESLGEQWVEMVSESTGGLFKALTVPIRGQLTKIGILKAFKAANPDKGMNDLRRVVEKLGYHGVLEEMLEERVAEIGHGILHPLGLSGQKFQMPSLEQLSVELVAFSIPGVAFRAMEEIRKPKPGPIGEKGQEVPLEMVPIELTEVVPEVKVVEQPKVGVPKPLPEPQVSRETAKYLELDQEFVDLRNRAIKGETLSDADLKRYEDLRIEVPYWMEKAGISGKEPGITPTEPLAEPEVPKKAMPVSEERVEAAIALPEGWTTKVVPNFRRTPGWQSEVDWKNKRIVFETAESAKNVDIKNHEIAHIRTEDSLGYIEKLSDSPFLSLYAKVRKEGKDTHINFIREHLAMDYGEYLTNPEKVGSVLKNLFKKYLPEKGQAAPPRVETVTEEIGKFPPDSKATHIVKINGKGFPAIVTRNTIPNEAPWRITWFDKNGELISHLQMDSPESFPKSFINGFGEKTVIDISPRVETVSVGKQYADKGLIHPDDAELFDYVNTVFQNVKSGFDWPREISIEPKSMPATGRAYYDYKNGKVLIAIRDKYLKRVGGRWAKNPKSDEEIIDLLGHELAHVYDQTHAKTSFRPKEQYFINEVKKAWNAIKGTEYTTQEIELPSGVEVKTTPQEPVTEPLEARPETLQSIIKSGRKEITEKELNQLPDVISKTRTPEDMRAYLELKGIMVVPEGVKPRVKESFDILTWVRSKGRIKEDTKSADVVSLTPRESGFTGKNALTTRGPGGRGLDEFAQEFEWETGRPITTDELTQAIKDTVESKKKGIPRGPALGATDQDIARFTKKMDREYERAETVAADEKFAEPQTFENLTKSADDAIMDFRKEAIRYGITEADTKWAIERTRTRVQNQKIPASLEGLRKILSEELSAVFAERTPEITKPTEELVLEKPTLSGIAELVKSRRKEITKEEFNQLPEIVNGILSPEGMLDFLHNIGVTVKEMEPELSATAKDQFKLPRIKQGLEMKGAKEVTPTLEGTPLMEAARKAEVEGVQPSMFKEGIEIIGKPGEPINVTMFRVTGREFQIGDFKGIGKFAGTKTVAENVSGGKGEVIPVNIKLDNPFEMTNADFRRHVGFGEELRTKLESQGYDGITIRYKNGEIGETVSFKKPTPEKTISQFTQEYKEGLGELGYIRIGGVEKVTPRVVTPGTKDLSLPEFGLTTLHVADRHPFIAPILKGNIKAEQNTNNWILRKSDRISEAFDKVEKPGIWMKIFGRKGTLIKDLDLMSEGKAPVPTQLTEFVTEIKGVLGDIKGEIIQKMKNDFAESLSSKQREYLDWEVGGRIGEEPKITVAEYSYTNKKGQSITVPEHTRPVLKATKLAVEEALKEFKEMEKWGFIDYFPHIFKGKYKYLTEDGHIIASGQTAKQAKANFEEYVESHPETTEQTFMFVNDFYDLLTVRKALNPELTNPLEYLGTRLSRKEFFHLLGRTEKVIKEEIANAGVADIPKVKVDMSGIASFQKGTKFSGHFLKRKTSLRGEETDPFKALMSYVFSVGRKLGLEDAKKASYAFADSLPKNMPNAKSYIKMQADNMSGRYNIVDKIFDETIGEKLGMKPFGVTRIFAKGVGLESKLKLGYAPAKTAINRMGSVFHIILQEGGKNYLEGRKLLKAKDPELMGRIEREGHLAGMEQLFAGEGLVGISKKQTSWWRPLGTYQMAEVKGRSEALAAAYVSGLKKFSGDKDAAWIYAIDSAQLTQFLYNTAAKPVLVRGPILQAMYQFKQYTASEIRFMSQLTPAQWAGYIPGMIALAGTRGALLTIKSIIGISIIGLGIDELMERLNRKAPRLHRGIFGLIGVDVSAPASWQIPSSVKDWIGVFPRDLWETGEMIIKGLKNEGWTDEQINDYIRQITPVGYNVFKGLQMLSEGVTKEGTKVIYRGGKAEGVINLAGAKSVKQSQASDSARYMNQQRQLFLEKTKVLEDRLFGSKNQKESEDIFKELVELKNIQTPEEIQDFIKGLRKSAESRQYTEEIRIFLTLPRTLKKEEEIRRR